MVKSFLFFTVFFSISASLCLAQDKNQPVSTKKLELLMLPNASLALQSSTYDISMFRQASVYGISSINIPNNTSNTLLRSTDKPGAFWRTDGSIVNYSDKFKNTLNNVANGKYFSVDAQNFGSSWIQQDAANAHKNNGYH